MGARRYPRIPGYLMTDVYKGKSHNEIGPSDFQATGDREDERWDEVWVKGLSP